MGVTDLNMRHATREPSGSSSRRSAHVRRQIGIRSTDGTSAAAYVATVCRALSESLPDIDVLASRSILGDGVCAIDLSRESARYRDVLACAFGKALPLGYSWADCTQHTGRCQREARLAHLSRSGIVAHSDGAQTLCGRRLRRRAEEHRLRARYHDHRSVSDALSVGTLSKAQSGGQASHAARSAREYPDVYPYFRRQTARGQCPGSDCLRGGQLLCDGSRVSRFWTLASASSGAGVLRHPRQIEPSVSAALLASDRQSERSALRSNHRV